MNVKMKLLTRMLLFFLLPAMVGMAGMVAVSFTLARDTVNEQINEELTLVTSGQVEALSNVVALLRSVTANLASAQRVTNLMTAVNAAGGFHPDTAPDNIRRMLPQGQQALASVVKHFERVSGAGLVDRSGTVVAHTTKTFIGANVAERNYFKQAIQGKSGLENVLSRASQTLSTIIAWPVMENSSIVGVAYISLSLPTLSTNTIETIKISDTGIAFVYDSQGMLLMHPTKEYVGNQDAKLPWVQKLLGSAQGRLDYVWNGVEKIATFKRVPETDWTVVVSIEKADVQAPLSRMLRFSLLLAAGISLLVGLTIFVVARNLSSVLRDSAAIVGSVAAGQFTLTAQENAKLDKDCARGDAIGHLAFGIKGMVDSLAKLFTETQQKTEAAEAATQQAEIATQQAEEARTAAEHARRDGMLAAAQQLEQVVAHISTSAHTLLQIIAESEQGTERQSLRISETAVAMEEMTSTVLEVSRSVSQTSGLTQNTREKAQLGAQLVEGSIKSIQRIQQDSLNLKQDMTALGQSAQDISQIMGVISDIADQTNLLALNAAIEAARAGEAGRGFAVVADEVRKLAEKTMSSTSDVANAIRAIQNNSDKSIAQVESAVVNIEHTTEQSLTSGTALSEIVALMETTADQVRAIATASEQQSATSEEINQSINQIDAIAHETASAMHKASVAVNEMVQQAAVLHQLVTQFKEG